jgi:phosphatidylglycerophosphate synthase
MKNRDITHLNILSVLHYVGGIYFFLAAFFISRYVMVGVSGFVRSQGTASPSESFTNWGEVIMLSALVIGMMVLGILLLLTGHSLRKHRARIFCLIVAGAECISFPLGTLVGVFTLIKLNKDSAKKLFANNH